LEKKKPGDGDDYRIFMALSNEVGQTSRGEPILKRDAEGNQVIKNGATVLGEDLS
jgi:type I restriction enzyme M protein